MRNYLNQALQYRSSKIIIGAVAAATLVFLAASVYLDLRSNRSLRQAAKTQFNDEQLVIARHIAMQIERELAFIRKELDMVCAMITDTTGLIPTIRGQLERPLSRILDNSVYRIDIVDSSEKEIHTFGYPRKWRHGPLKSGVYDTVLKTIRDTPDTYISHPRKGVGGMRILMARMTADATHLVALELDVTRFISWFLRNIRSGQTGYAWIMDDHGIFLYHPYADFIGKSAFTARETRDPDISQQTINLIQKNKMMEGRTGTGSFTAGWHRGFTGQIEKLIGYCPIEVATQPAQKWSVAVVAPASEIEGYINTTYFWRSLFQAVIILLIVSAGSTLLFNEIRWVRRLEEQVAARTDALKASEEKYRSLVESAEDFIFTINRQGRFQSMNSFTAAFFGGRPEDFIGRDLDQILPRESSQKHRKMLHLVFHYERSVRDEFTLRAGEHEIWISANFMPIRDESGQVNSVLCIARDITNEKQLERQLINTEKMASLGTLAAGVAHEINNPLGVILGFCDCLIRNTAKDSQDYEDLKTIERQGIHCKQIVENLLRFARFGGGAENYADINEGITEIISIVSHTLELESIELVTCLTDNIPVVRGDPRELQQVFLNLITNACAAMKGGGTLTIRSEYNRKEKRAIVYFEDTGHGIAPDDLDRIFEPFFTTKPEGEGTGLGLSVTYGIISKYGGMIDCKSVYSNQPSAGERHGTQFTIKLPIYEMEN